MTFIESLLLITNLLIIFLCYLNHIGIKLLMKIVEAMVNQKNQRLTPNYPRPDAPPVPPRKPPKEF